MNLTLREMLHLSPAASAEETKHACNQYFLMYCGVYKDVKDPAVRDLAQNRIEELKTAAEKEGLHLSFAEMSADGGGSSAGIDAAYSAFNGVGGGKASPSQAKQMEQMIAGLPECAEKHFLQGNYILLTQGLTRQTVGNFAASISAASRLDSQNPIYPAILLMAQNAVKTYNKHLQTWRDNEDNRIKEEEKRIKAEKTKETTISVFKTIGTGLLTVLGLIATAAVGLFGFLCECFSDCDC